MRTVCVYTTYDCYSLLINNSIIGMSVGHYSWMHEVNCQILPQFLSSSVLLVSLHLDGTITLSIELIITSKWSSGFLLYFFSWRYFII